MSGWTEDQLAQQNREVFGWKPRQAERVVKGAGLGSGTPKRHKYGAVKSEVDGITFDSKAEAAAYQKLKIEFAAGIITKLERQVPFILQDAFIDGHGKRVRPIKYICDFLIARDGKAIAIDVKGYITPEFRIKEKLFKRVYPTITMEIWK